MNAFNLTILEANSYFYEGSCISLVVPTVDGLYGILAGHSNLITAMVPGEIQCRKREEDDFEIYSVSNGLVKIEDGDVMILADSVERLDEIDVNRARREAEDAKETLARKASLREFIVARTQLDRAVNRVKIYDKYKSDGFDT